MALENSGELLGVGAVASMLAVKKATVRAWAGRGIMPSPLQLSGRTQRWRRCDVENWLAEKGGREVANARQIATTATA